MLQLHLELILKNCYKERSVYLALAISSICSSSYTDAKYQRILQELMRLGIAPSGNKSVDKNKLEQAKTELIQKIQTRNNEEEKQSLQVQPLEGVKDTQDSKRAQMEEQRLGAMTLTELNRMYFGI